MAFVYSIPSSFLGIVDIGCIVFSVGRQIIGRMHQRRRAKTSTFACLGKRTFSQIARFRIDIRQQGWIIRLRFFTRSKCILSFDRFCSCSREKEKENTHSYICHLVIADNIFTCLLRSSLPGRCYLRLFARHCPRTDYLLCLPIYHRKIGSQ